MKNPLLQSSDLKTTKRRLAILFILESSSEPLTADEIYSQVVKEVPMSLSTAYRCLNTLTEKGILLKNASADGKAYYQIRSQTHKHQLVCTLCSKVVPIEHCPLTNLEEKLMEQTGFAITGHSLEFSGICPKCAQHGNQTGHGN